MLSKFRLSDLELNIETEAHRNVKRDEQCCPFSNDDSIKDDYHILIQCSKYFQKRNTLFFKISHTSTQFRPGFLPFKGPGGSLGTPPISLKLAK